MTAKLTDALAALGSLTHDQLTDLIDLLDAWAGVEGIHQRRKGKTIGLEQHNTSPSGALAAVVEAARLLSDDERATLRLAVATLRDALAPREFSPAWAGRPTNRAARFKQRSLDALASTVRQMKSRSCLTD